MNTPASSESLETRYTDLVDPRCQDGEWGGRGERLMLLLLIFSVFVLPARASKSVQIILVRKWKYSPNLLELFSTSIA